MIACDGESTSSYLRVDVDGKVSGAIDRLNIPQENLARLANVIKDQEKLFVSLKNQTISDAFVFQFQPLDDTPHFVTQLVSASTRKANRNISKLFKNIAAQLKLLNTVTLAYAADGDSAYNSLTNKTIYRWDYIGRLIIDFLKPSFTNDPLHVIKRARPRLLSQKLVPIYKNFQILNVTAATTLFNDMLHRTLSKPCQLFVRRDVELRRGNLDVRS